MVAKTTIQGILLLAVLTVGLLAARPQFADSIFHPEDAGIRAAVADANRDVATDAKAVTTVLKNKDKLPECKNPDGTINIPCWERTHNPVARHVWDMRLAANRQIGLAKGEYFKSDRVSYLASSPEWQPTRIPIHSCMELTVQAETTVGTYFAGPDGVDLDKYTPKNRASWLRFNGEKTTLVPGIPWGTVLGKVCDDAAGRNCSRPFPIGKGGHTSPQQIGHAGKLWSIVNGIVSGHSDAFHLNGVALPVMSDYSNYGGTIDIDFAEADGMCGVQTSL